MGFKTTISSGWSVQIISNSVCALSGPVAIDLFCSLSCTVSVTEIQLAMLMHISCSIHAIIPRKMRSILPFHNKY